MDMTFGARIFLSHELGDLNVCVKRQAKASVWHGYGDSSSFRRLVKQGAQCVVDVMEAAENECTRGHGHTVGG